MRTGLACSRFVGTSTTSPWVYCGLIVGRCSLDEPEIACELLKRFHGGGYATEAAHAVMRAAFATGRHRIWSTVGAWNEPSLRVLDKLGFQRHHQTVDDRGAPLVYLVRQLHRGYSSSDGAPDIYPGRGWIHLPLAIGQPARQSFG
jgi:RimJ/RimL family protein N-acetyltransferase